MGNLPATVKVHVEPDSAYILDNGYNPTEEYGLLRIRKGEFAGVYVHNHFLGTPYDSVDDVFRIMQLPIDRNEGVAERVTDQRIINAIARRVKRYDRLGMLPPRAFGEIFGERIENGVMCFG